MQRGVEGHRGIWRGTRVQKGMDGTKGMGAEGCTWVLMDVEVCRVVHSK